jgi:hypothetical protein
MFVGEEKVMKVADQIWVATALLHQDHPAKPGVDFSIQEIVQRAVSALPEDGYRPGLPIHASLHCVANKPSNPAPYQMLYETAHGRRRLFRAGDDIPHKYRRKGKIHPRKADLPAKYQPLVDWDNEVDARSRDIQQSQNQDRPSAARQAGEITSASDRTFNAVLEKEYRGLPKCLKDLRTGHGVPELEPPARLWALGRMA